MKKKYISPIGIAFLAITTILSTSFIPLEISTADLWPEPGKYELTVKGQEVLCLQGNIFYNSTQDQLSAWNLVLRDESKAIEHALDFYIADQKYNNGVELGDYRISENVEGFFKEFQGVFGVADIDQFGELPYFTEAGLITINKIQQETLAGHLQLVLSNNKGETIQVEGKFVAPKDELERY